MSSFHAIRFSKRFFTAAGLFATMMLAARAQTTVGVQILTQQPGPAIATHFTGLSFEMQYVLADTNGNHFFSPANKQLIATFKQLGIKNLRVGGNTADRPSIPTPGETDVDSLFAFAGATDVKVIYTLRLNQGSLDAAVKMANYISRKYHDHLDCFAIGNEPNVFSKTYPPYLAEWKKYVTAITAATNSPGAKFCGPSTSPGHESWAADFANEFGGHGPLALIAQHDYPGGDARSATNVAAARDKLLSSDMDAHYAKFAANFVPTVLSNGLAFRFEEANSFYDGGALDASDTFASALWALNYQWWWVEHGMIGINFHTGDKVAARDMNKPCRYASFWTTPDGYNVHPIGYAEKMFSMGSQGRILPVNILPLSATNLNFAAYALLGDDKNIYVTLINRSHDATATNLSVQIGARAIDGWAKGEIIRLTAPDNDVARKTGVTLGGAEITDAGEWSGQWQPVLVPMQKSQFVLLVDVPAASAAVVKLTPRETVK